MRLAEKGKISATDLIRKKHRSRGEEGVENKEMEKQETGDTNRRQFDSSKDVHGAILMIVYVYV